MAHIKKISFSASDSIGCTCDRCGQHIKNIWTVEFTDAPTTNFGIDCYEKLYKGGKLNKFGVTLMNRTLKSIKLYTEKLEMWKNITEEEADRQGFLEDLKPESVTNRYCKSYWCCKTFEEFRDWVVNEFYSCRLEEAQKEVDKFAKVNF